MAKAKITEETARMYAGLLATAVGTLRQLEAEMNNELNQIKESYQSQSLDIQEKVKEYDKVLSKYASENPDIFPKDKKSVEWGSVIISKRITTPKVGIPSGAKWEDVVSKLKAMNLPEYVRTVEEVDKEKIIGAVSSAEGEAIRGKIAMAGITVTQTEKINIEVKEEELINS
jgi:phage host-nuclease inhibitor protein Gam